MKDLKESIESISFGDMKKSGVGDGVSDKLALSTDNNNNITNTNSSYDNTNDIRNRIKVITNDIFNTNSSNTANNSNNNNNTTKTTNNNTTATTTNSKTSFKIKYFLYFSYFTVLILMIFNFLIFDFVYIFNK